MSRHPFSIAIILVFVYVIIAIMPGYSSPPPEMTSQSLLSKIADNKGKVVIVNFWATWCSTCQEEIEILKELRDNYPEDNVKFLSISIDEDPEKINDYIQSQGFNFQTFSATEGILSDFSIKWVPKTYVFNHNGQIIYKDFGLVSQKRLEGIIDKILENL